MSNFTERELEIVERFRAHVEETAKKNDISFLFSEESHVPYPSNGMLVNGYMIEYPERVLAIGAGKPVELWLPILAHESSHMDQLIERDPTWDNSYVSGTTIETIEVIDLWMNKKIELTPDQLDEYIRLSREVELDCERRTVEKIKSFGLPISVSEYIQKANSYIFFYTAMKETKSWYVAGKEPYRKEDVWSLCPTEFLADADYEKVPEDLMKAYRKILE